MRLVALALPLLFLVPVAVASQEYRHNYIVGLQQGCGGGGMLIQNCETYGPYAYESRIWANATDMSLQTIRLRVCHEWTYDDGSHARVKCNEGCSPSFSDALQHPPWPWNTTYRVIVDLRNGPGACQTEASMGTLDVTFR